MLARLIAKVVTACILIALVTWGTLRLDRKQLALIHAMTPAQAQTYLIQMHSQTLGLRIVIWTFTVGVGVTLYDLISWCLWRPFARGTAQRPGYAFPIQELPPSGPPPNP